MTIKRPFVLITFLMILLNSLNNQVIAQTDNIYDDLLVLLVNEEYKDCYNKSIKYTLKEKTKKDPLPYLFAAKSSYEMSRDHKYTEEFPKAFKTAMSFAAKYRKKDKEYTYKEDAEEFINEFKMVIIEEVENYILEGTDKTYGKAVSLSKKISDMDPEDYGAKLLYALLCTLTKNNSKAKEVLKICIPKLEEYGKNKFSLKYMNKSQQFILRFSLMEYANYYKAKDPAKAKIMLDYGIHLFYDENEFSKISYIMDYKLVYDNL